MSNIQLTPKQIKASLYKEMQQPYIQKQIPEPFIDESKLLILSEISHRIPLPQINKKKLIVTVMLVQIALDTHEKIPNKNTPCMDETEKQLSVLAGDFYSGLYYYLLANINEIEMIQVLARAIKQINEYKMVFFYKEKKHVDEIIDLVTELESILLYNVADAYNLGEDFSHLIKLVYKYNIINDELSSLIHQEKSTSKYNILEDMNTIDVNDMIKYLEKMLIDCYSEMNDYLDRLDFQSNQFKINLLKSIKLMYSTSLAEEG